MQKGSHTGALLYYKKESKVKKCYVLLLVGTVSFLFLPVSFSSRENGNFNKTKIHTVADGTVQSVPASFSSVNQLNGGFNAKAKQQDVIDLVESGISFFDKNSLDVAMNAFTHEQQFNVGELYLFVFDYNGVCFAHGSEEELIWKDMYDAKDSYGSLFVQEIISQADEGGGWVSYSWRGASKRSYVKKITKEENSYVIGCGYYPHSKSDAVVDLVKGAIQHFKDVVIARGGEVTEAFSTISYPLGQFIKGDLYLYALNFEGTIMAQGERPGLIGTNTLEYKDAEGVYVNQEIIKKLQKTSGGIWQEYISKNAPKIVYAEGIEDLKGKRYFIACGYYPDADRRQVVELVKRGYQFFKRNGRSTASSVFSDKRSNQFRYGDLSLVVHSFDGKIIADGGNPDLVGMSAIDFQDQDEKYIVREFISKAKSGGGWISYKLKNAYKISYIEQIELGTEKYVISSGFYPISKEENMILMVKGAVSAFNAEIITKSLRKFVTINGGFLRGDLWIYVIESSGIVLAWGIDETQVWKNMINERDDNGQPYVRTLLNTAKRGPARVTFKTQGKERMAYAQQVKRDGRTYLIGSSYYS